jgi:hypothetical protein
MVDRLPASGTFPLLANKFRASVISKGDAENHIVGGRERHTADAHEFMVGGKYRPEPDTQNYKIKGSKVPLAELEEILDFD